MCSSRTVLLTHGNNSRSTMSNILNNSHEGCSQETVNTGEYSTNMYYPIRACADTSAVVAVCQQYCP